MLSSQDVDYGTWRQGVSALLHGGRFSGGIGEKMEHFDTTFSATDTTIIQNTDVMAQANSSYLANSYIGAVVDSEQQRVGKLDAMAKRDVYKLREQSMGVVYTAALCKFLATVTRMVLFASILIVGILSATAQDVITKRTGIFLAMAVVIITGVSLLAMISLAATRRNDAWGRYYWNSRASGSAVNTSAANPT